MFTADTGASKTVISEKVYERIDKRVRPPLEKTSCLIGPEGSPINGKGKATFGMQLGQVKIVKEAVVAAIEDDVLLGFDVLRGDGNGPADILLSKGKIVMNGSEIPCIQIGGEVKARKVRVADETRIPGKSETLVNVFVERREADDIERCADYLVEPTDHFKETYHLVMAKTMVDINHGPTCLVRVMNPFPSDVTLYQDAEIGQAEKIERVISVVATQESTDECANLHTIRRVGTKNTPTVVVTEHAQANPDEVPEHLIPLFQKSTKDKNEYEKQVVAGLLCKYANTFSKNDWDIGLTHLTEHAINTEDATPIKQRPRRVPMAYAVEEKKAIEDLMQKGVIQKSTSPWASPIVLVRKKSGAIRPCVDYRKVNALVKPDGFPLPRIQDCLDAVAGSKWFSSLDLTSGYFQIPLRREDIPKSAFTCKYGQYEMTRMPFGLNNSASTFQRTMELALQGLQWITCLVYIDDIIIYGTTFDEHISRVDEVLDRIRTAGLKLKPEKCSLLQNEVVFLGHVVSKHGVQPDPSNVAKVLGWPTPINAKQVKQFVATGSYYRRFIKNFAKITRPLVDLTKKDAKFIWTNQCEEAFQEVKQALVSPEVMGYPLNEGGTFILDTDASGVGIGAVLAQIQEERERVIAYASRAMNKAERNYCITEQELLAVVFFIQYFRQYLLGRRFLVRTDHQALVWLFRLKEPNGKIARWIEILAPFDFQIEYRAGNKQAHCDALSRCPFPRDCTCSEVDMSEPLKCGPCKKCRRRAEIMLLEQPHDGQSEVGGDMSEQVASVAMLPVRALESAIEQPGTSGEDKNKPVPSRNWLIGEDRSSIRQKQLQDLYISPILIAKEAGMKPNSTDMQDKSPECRHYWVIWDALVIIDGVLYRHLQKVNGTDSYDQIIVPRGLRQEIIRQSHDSLTAGHLGVKKTKARIAQSFYWFNIRQDVHLYIQQCDVCAADKTPKTKPKAPMGHITTGAPWDVLAMDYVGPFPETTRGNKYILVLTDLFTKYVEVMPVPNQSAEVCASKILNEFVARWGVPLSIHSDQGGAFESNVFKDLCKMLQTRKTRTSPRNPKANGQAERFNKTLVKMIKAYLVDSQDDWDLNLGCLAGAYRSTPHESTKLSPNLLCFGREIRMPADLLFGHAKTTRGTTPSYAGHVLGLREKMLAAHEVARKHLKQSAKRSKEIYDSKLSFRQYHVGDLVWCLHETRKVGVNPKLEKGFDGPFLVTAKHSCLNFTIQLNANGQKRLVHHDKLKMYEGRNVPKWIKKVKQSLRSEDTH